MMSVDGDKHTHDNVKLEGVVEVWGDVTPPSQIVTIFFIGTRNECDDKPDNGGGDEHADDEDDKGW